MKVVNIISVMLFALISFGANAQVSQDERDLVMYDPLFWRDKLAIRGEQVRQIEQINTEFYENLRSIKAEQPNQPEANRRQLEEGLQQRSQKIWETLQPKQRRRLEKIIDKTTPVVAP